MIAFPHKPALYISPALEDGNSVVWRSGSCVASKDCGFGNSISAFTYSVDLGFWINSTCCQGNCQELTPLGTLPPESSRGWPGKRWGDCGGEFVLS